MSKKIDYLYNKIPCYRNSLYNKKQIFIRSNDKTHFKSIKVLTRSYAETVTFRKFPHLGISRNYGILRNVSYYSHHLP